MVLLFPFLHNPSSGGVIFPPGWSFVVGWLLFLGGGRGGWQTGCVCFCWWISYFLQFSMGCK